jgi:hypothetical protein
MRERSTMQTPQGFDATHSDELFPSLAQTQERKGPPAAVRNFWMGWMPTRRSFGRKPQRSTLQTPQGLDATHDDELFPLFEFLEETEDRPPSSRRADRAEIGLGSILGAAQPTNFGAPLTHAREVVTGDPSLQTQEREGPPRWSEAFGGGWMPTRRSFGRKHATGNNADAARA